MTREDLIGLCSLACLFILAVAFIRHEFRTKKAINILRKENDYLRLKWTRATRACARFAADARPDTEEERQLVRHYNRQWKQATQYHVYRAVQISPFERECLQEKLDKACDVLGLN